MQITLNQDEILAAIDSHVRSQINIAAGQSVSIELKATRGDTGFTAILDIVAIPRANNALAVSAVLTDSIATSAVASVTNVLSAVVENKQQAGATAAPAPAAKPVFGKLKAAAPAPAPEPEPTEEAGEEEAELETSEEDLEEAADKASVDEPEENDDAAPAPAPRSIFSKAKG